jgi:putative transposase
LTYYPVPYKYWTRIRTNNVIERLNREIRRCTGVVVTGWWAPFPNGN